MFLPLIKLCDVKIITYLVVYLMADIYCEGKNQLIEITTNVDVCPGIVTYECIVFGGTLDIFTVWKGDFFNCPTGIGEIHLIHGEREGFNPHTCNDGNVLGRFVRIENDSFISQLNVTLACDIIGKSIECIRDNGTNIERVGTMNLTSVMCNKDCQDLPLTTSSGGNGYNILLPATIPSLTSLLLLLAVVVLLSLYILKKKSLTDLRCQKASQSIQHKEYGRTSQDKDENDIKFFDNTLNGTYNLVELDIQTESETERKVQNDDDTNTIKIFDNRLNGTYNIVELGNIQNELQKEEAQQEDSVQLTLNNLLTRLQGRVSSHWYQFGSALGVPKDILEELSDYLDEDALVEILDYWLRNCHQPSWQEVANVVKKAELSDFNDQQ